jgi:hypothetical protein
MEAERSNLLPFGIILILTSEFDLDSHDMKGPAGARVHWAPAGCFWDDL